MPLPRHGFVFLALKAALNFIRELFTVNTVILIVSVGLLYWFLDHVNDIYYDEEKLLPHTGVVETKYIDWERAGEDSVETIRIKLYDNPVIYSASGRIVYLDYAINPGDSIRLFTKPITSFLGNTVNNGSGSTTTHDPNYVFHLISLKDGTVVIDFQRHRDNVSSVMWLLLFFSIVFFLWYLYRRLGWYSPFIMDN